MTGSGYRTDPAGGARMRADIVDVYVFRVPQNSAGAVEFLLLERAAEPLAGTWHPLMGHVESGETAPRTAIRELREEVGLGAGDGALLGLWALEQVHPYYVPELDCIVLSPRFAARVTPFWEPTLNHEHSDYRWVTALNTDPDAALRQFLWPGQKNAVREILAEIVPADGAARERLAIDPARFSGPESA